MPVSFEFTSNIVYLFNPQLSPLALKTAVVLYSFMKIAIFETGHFEAVYPVIRYFDKPGHQLLIITKNATLEHLRYLLKEEETAHFSWHIINDTQGRLLFFKELERALDEFDPNLIWFNTISSNHFFFARLCGKFSKRSRIILTVHDINCLFKPQWEWNIRSIIQYAGKKALRNSVSAFNVISSTLIPYLKPLLRPGLAIHTISGSIFEKKNRPLAWEMPLRLCVPGSLDSGRRNYEEVFALLSLLEQAGIQAEINLLGGHHSLDDAFRIINRAKNYNGRVARILIHEQEVIDQETYEEMLAKAHFIFLPSVINTRICGRTKEIYGITKSSGVVYDAVRHARPLIIPAALAVDNEIESSCLKYHEISQVRELLQKFITNPQEYEVLCKRSLDNSQAYTIESIRRKNPGL